MDIFLYDNGSSIDKHRLTESGVLPETIGSQI